MKTKFDFATLAGMLTWLMVYAISMFILHKTAAKPPLWLIHLLFLSYGALFYLLTRPQGRFALRGRLGKTLLAVQLAVAFSLLWLLPVRNFEFLSILTIIWVAMLPFVLSTAISALVALIVVAAWFAVVAWQSNSAVWITALLYGSFHLFALLVQSASRDAEQAKAELEQKHQQLQATQQLLQAASRQSERTRIARNLHDLVGHHLTALTIQLQVAGHLAQGELKSQIDKCHQLAKLLLSDVRDAVSTMRQFADMTLTDALQPLVALVPQQLSVRLDIQTRIMLHDLHQAQHLLYVIQEALSNSLKHSGATQLTLKAFISAGQLVIQIHDNGTLPSQWRAGNGIKGMQERLAECGGTVTFGRQQQAMALTLTLPYQESEDD